MTPPPASGGAAELGRRPELQRHLAHLMRDGMGFR
jgi:hypothetical protein